MQSGSISAGVVYDIDYRCRPMSNDGDDREEGTVRAYWTGEIDTWGKLTFVPTNGTDTIYLFKDEIIDTARCGIEGRR